MKILVTGAAGFVGSVLSIVAAEDGHEVFAVDDNSRGLNTLVRATRGVEFLERDCREGLGDAIGSFRPEAVVHLAAGTGSLDRPLAELRDLNLEMTRKVFADALEAGTKVFAFPTTSLALAVPDSPYVVSKEEAMAWLLDHAERHRLLPLRFFNLIGAHKGATERRRNEVHIVPCMVECHVSGRPFVVNGADWDTKDGTPSRDFTNVVDAAEFILAAIGLKTHGMGPKAAADRCVWVGTGRPTTVLEMVAHFQRLVGPLRVEVGGRRPYDCAALQCDPGQVAQFRRVLGRTPRPAWLGLYEEARELLPVYQNSTSGYVPGLGRLEVRPR